MKKMILAAIAFTMGSMGSMAFGAVEVQGLSSWGELKEICQNPGKMNLQRPPGQIEATCDLTKLNYRTIDQVDTLSYPGEQVIGFEASSDKANVQRLTGPVDIAPQEMQCPRLVQVESKYSLSFATTCEEIVNHEGDFSSFCSDRLALDNAEELEQYKVSETEVEGTEHSICGDSTL